MQTVSQAAKVPNIQRINSTNLNNVMFKKQGICLYFCRIGVFELSQLVLNKGRGLRKVGKKEPLRKEF